MPEHTLHDRATIITAVVTTSMILWPVSDLASTVGWGAGVLTALVINPDLDVDAGSHSMCIVRRICGRLIGGLWRGYWWPYAKLFKHRGLSHCPLIGTLTRIIYFLPAWYIWYVFIWLAGAAWPWYFLAGLALADAVHWALDVLDAKVFKGKL